MYLSSSSVYHSLSSGPEDDSMDLRFPIISRMDLVAPLSTLDRSNVPLEDWVNGPPRALENARRAYWVVSPSIDFQVLAVSRRCWANASRDSAEAGLDVQSDREEARWRRSRFREESEVGSGSVPSVILANGSSVADDMLVRLCCVSCTCAGGVCGSAIEKEKEGVAKVCDPVGAGFQRSFGPFWVKGGSDERVKWKVLECGRSSLK